MQVMPNYDPLNRHYAAFVNREKPEYSVTS